MYSSPLQLVARRLRTRFVTACSKKRIVYSIVTLRTATAIDDDKAYAAGAAIKVAVGGLLDLSELQMFIYWGAQLTMSLLARCHVAKASTRHMPYMCYACCVAGRMRLRRLCRRAAHPPRRGWT